MMDIINEPEFYSRLSTQANKLTSGLQQVADKAGIAFSTRQQGGMFGLFFADKAANNFDELERCDLNHFKRFFHAMLDHGVYLAPSAYEAGFISSCHDDDIIDQTLAAAEKAITV